MKLEIEIRKKSYEAIKNNKIDYYEALDGLLAIKEGKQILEDKSKEMTLKEFKEAIDREPEIRDYLVKIKIKYKNETEYRYLNELLLVSPPCFYEWANDWFEGEEDVRIVDYKAIEDIEF